MDRAEEPDCCSVDKVVQSWDTRNPVISSNSSFVKACGTIARVSNHEDAANFETNVQVEEEHKSALEELEDRNDLVEEVNKNEKDVEDEKGHTERSDKGDETSKREEELEIDSRNNSTSLVGEENLNCSVSEDDEAENLQDTIDEEAGVETSDGECDDDEEKAEEYRSKKKVDLRKMTLGEWFQFMEVHVQKQIVEETEKMFELMRSKALRVDQYIAEQKQAKGKDSMS